MREDMEMGGSVCVCVFDHPSGPADLSSKEVRQVYLESVFLVDVVVHRQHGDVETGQQNTSQDVVFFLICTTERTFW